MHCGAHIRDNRTSKKMRDHGIDSELQGLSFMNENIYDTWALTMHS